MPVFQLVFLLAILAASVIGGVLPLLRRFEAGPLLSRGNALAAGVFLGAGWLHMLPEAADDWGELTGDPEWAFALAAMGFLLMLAAEHVLPGEGAHDLIHAPSSERFHALERLERKGRAALTVLIALSVHALLAGLALGSAPRLPDALVLFVAILGHKTMEGFALGVSLARSPMERSLTFTLLGVFAAATPLGILLGAGLGVRLEGPVRDGFEAVFLSLAAGTFVYVALLDILRDELVEPGSRLALFGLVLVGVGAMGVLALST